MSLDLGHLVFLEKEFEDGHRGDLSRVKAKQKCLSIQETGQAQVFVGCLWILGKLG
jgi:hypothetical protein